MRRVAVIFLGGAGVVYFCSIPGSVTVSEGDTAWPIRSKRAPT